MRMFVVDPSGHRIYLIIPYQIVRRLDLPSNFSVFCQYCRRTYSFSREDVLAEPDMGNTTIGGATIGGIIGILAGPFGALIGVVLGTAIGRIYEETERERIRNFG